jgi:hypothetical protein
METIDRTQDLKCFRVIRHTRDNIMTMGPRDTTYKVMAFSAADAEFQIMGHTPSDMFGPTAFASVTPWDAPPVEIVVEGEAGMQP